MTENQRPVRRGPGGGHGPMAGGEKPKNFKKTWGKLLKYSGKYLPALIMAVVFAILSTVCSLIGPGKLSDITNLIKDGLMTGIDLEAVSYIALFLAIIYGTSLILGYFQSFIMATITQKISRRMRSQISHKINRLPLKYFDSTSVGEVLSRVTNDVDTIGTTMNMSLGTLVSSVTLFIGSLIMMLATNVVMAFTAVVSSLVGFALMMVIVTRSQKYFARQQASLGNINGHIEEIYSGHNVVRAYNGTKSAKAEFVRLNDRLYDSAWKSQFLSGLMMPLMSFIGNFSYVAVCIVGAMLAIGGTIPFGTIVAFIVYVRLFNQPMSQIAQAATNMQSTAAAGERVFEFLEQEEMSDESHKIKKLDAARGDVEFDHVSFRYNPDKPIINDFSASIKAGQKVAIVGPTGAGKTTMVNLLMRFYEVNSGKITIDSVPTTELTRENVHDLFCMVLQDTWLFEGTIRENIVYSKTDATDEDVIRACKAVGLHHFIMTLPKGYDTVLNDKASLSAGQKQLVTIARAMIENAPMLILDEATSSVDTRTEVLIQEAMDQLTKGRTSFVIAHRLSTIKNADVIFVMKDGDIVESGSHDQLLAKKGFYAELYNSQFESAG